MMASHTATNTGAGAPPNMDWLLSEPLLDAALKQISSLEQFAALTDSFQIAQENGQEIPDSIRMKLDAKRKRLHAGLILQESDSFLKASGLFPLLEAKRKWDDVHFMAEAHGVGSSIPMVSYTGLSQEEMESGMNSFYNHLELARLSIKDKALQKDVANVIVNAYKEVHETATGEFGGYEPFKSMVDHTPEKVKEIIDKKCLEEQKQVSQTTDTAMEYLTSQAQFP